MEQQIIDWTRAAQLALLRDVMVPDRVIKGSTVSGALQTAVLKCIDDHAGRSGECWVGYNRLAAITRYSIRSVKRAIAALEDASLIIVLTKLAPCGVVVNHYRIVWTELDLLPRVGSSRPVPDRPQPSERSAMVSERSATMSDQSAMVSRPECHGDTQTADRSAMKRNEPPPPTPPKSDGGGGGVSWNQVVEEWRQRIGQIAVLAREAQATGISPEEFLCRVRAAWEMAVHPFNRQSLRKPAGAVVHWLRMGAWPVDGLIDPRDQAAVQERSAAASRRDREAERSWQQSQMIKLVQEGRKAKASDEAIKAALLKHWPAADVAAFGW